jgi:ketosteroid isomerase-like protein
MASKKSVNDVVRKLYQARKRGDLDAMASLTTPNFIFEIVGDSKLCRIAGKTKGRAAFRARMESLIEFAFANEKLVSLVVDGDHAVVHRRMKVTYKPTDKSGMLDYIDRLTFKNSKIATLLQFVDTALVADIMRP